MYIATKPAFAKLANKNAHKLECEAGWLCFLLICCISFIGITIAGGVLGHNTGVLVEGGSLGVVSLALFAVCYEPRKRRHNSQLRQATRNGDIVKVPSVIMRSFEKAAAKHLPRGTNPEQVVRDSTDTVVTLLPWAEKYDVLSNGERRYSDATREVEQIINGEAEIACLELRDRLRAEAQQREEQQQLLETAGKNEAIAIEAGERAVIEPVLSSVQTRLAALLGEDDG